MALSPAEKQRCYRQQQSALTRNNPEGAERELLQEVERRCGGGFLGLGRRRGRLLRRVGSLQERDARWPHDKITLRNRARIIERSWED